MSYSAIVNPDDANQQPPVNQEMVPKEKQDEEGDKTLTDSEER